MKLRTTHLTRFCDGMRIRKRPLPAEKSKFWSLKNLVLLYEGQVMRQSQESTTLGPGECGIGKLTLDRIIHPKPRYMQAAANQTGTDSSGGGTTAIKSSILSTNASSSATSGLHALLNASIAFT